MFPMAVIINLLNVFPLPSAFQLVQNGLGSPLSLHRGSAGYHGQALSFPLSKLFSTRFCGQWMCVGRYFPAPLFLLAFDPPLKTFSMKWCPEALAGFACDSHMVDEHSCDCGLYFQVSAVPLLEAENRRDFKRNSSKILRKPGFLKVKLSALLVGGWSLRFLFPQ